MPNSLQEKLGLKKISGLVSKAASNLGDLVNQALTDFAEPTAIEKLIGDKYSPQARASISSAVAYIGKTDNGAARKLLKLITDYSSEKDAQLLSARYQELAQKDPKVAKQLVSVLGQYPLHSRMAIAESVLLYLRQNTGSNDSLGNALSFLKSKETIAAIKRYTDETNFPQDFSEDMYRRVSSSNDATNTFLVNSPVYALASRAGKVAADAVMIAVFDPALAQTLLSKISNHQEPYAETIARTISNVSRRDREIARFLVEEIVGKTPNLATEAAGIQDARRVIEFRDIALMDSLDRARYSLQVEKVYADFIASKRDYSGTRA